MEKEVMMKFKKGLVVGLSTAGLMAVGCGGGGGTITPVAPVATINGGGASPSMSSVSGSINKAALAGVVNGTTAVSVKVYSMSGVLVDSVASTTLPYKVSLAAGTMARTYGVNEGGLVARVSNSDNSIDFKVIMPLRASEGDFNNGATNPETADVSSTVVASLVEFQLSNALSKTVKLGVAQAGATQAELKTMVTDATAPVAPVSLAEYLEKGVNTNGSLLDALVDDVKAKVVTKTDTALSDIIGKFVTDGVNVSAATAPNATALTNAKSVLQLTNDMTQALRAGSNGTISSSINAATLWGDAVSTTSWKALLGGLTIATASSHIANFNAAAQAASICSVTNAGADCSNTANAMITNVTANPGYDAGAQIQAVADYVSPLMTPDVFNASPEVVGGFSAVGAAYNADAVLLSSINKVQKSIEEILANASADINARYLGGMINAPVANTTALGNVLQNVSTKVTNVPLSRVLAKASPVAIARVISAPGAYVSNLVKEFAGSGRPGSANVAKNANIAVQPTARIQGESGEYKAGTVVTFVNNSKENPLDASPVVNYTWSIGGTAVTTAATQYASNISFDSQQLSFTLTSADLAAFPVTLKQVYKASASATTEMTSEVTVMVDPVVGVRAPVITAVEDGVNFAQSDLGKNTKTFTANVVIPDYQASTTVTVSAAATNSPAGITLAVDSAKASYAEIQQHKVTVTAATTAAAGTYEGKLTVAAGGKSTSYPFEIVVAAPVYAASFGASDTTGFTNTNIKMAPYVYVDAASVTATSVATLFIDANDNKLYDTGDTLILTKAVSAGKTDMTTNYFDGSDSTANTAGIYDLALIATVNGATPVKATQALVIDKAGVPTVSSVTVDGVYVTPGQALTANLPAYPSTSPVEVNVDVKATGTTTLYKYSVNNHTVQDFSTTSAYKLATTTPGTYDVRIEVKADANATDVATRGFEITVAKPKEIVFGGAMLVTSSNAMTQLATSVEYGSMKLAPIATAVISLADNNMSIALGTNTPASDNVANTTFDIAVNVTELGTLRKAGMTVKAAEITATTTGYVVTKAGQVTFTGTKGDGTTSATVTKNSSADVPNFANMFVGSSQAQPAMMVSVGTMLASMQSILTSNNNNFATTFRQETGTNVSVEVVITPSTSVTFYNVAGTSFGKFVAENLTVK